MTAPAGTAAAVGASGLSAGAAAGRLAEDGPNVLVPEASGHRLVRLLGPLADPMVLLLLIAAPTYLLIGETFDAFVAFVALVPIISVGWLLEARADRTLDQLRKLTAARATIVRGGIPIELETEGIVTGDLILLSEGDIVPADAKVVDLTQLLVDESALTGESLPVSKSAGSPSDELLWAGTTVLSGRAAAVVTVTGTRTRYGQIGVLVGSLRQSSTPLQQALGRLVGTLTAVAGVFCVAVVVAELLNGHGWGEAVIAGVSLAIAAIPEEFSMVYSLYLALGAWRLAQQGALVRRLPSVETLGSTTVICTDKTGTLTHGRLTVADVWHIGANSEESTIGDGAAISELLEFAVLACEPQPFDPLDVAIAIYAKDHGIDPTTVQLGQLSRDWPFDPIDKYVTHTWSAPNGTPRVATKGSIEGVFMHCASSPEDRAAAEAANLSFAAAGMRVIAIAGGTHSVEDSEASRAEDEKSLRFLGLVAFTDPVRAGVSEALEQCRSAGIRVIMITGDHPATAHAIAEDLNLPHQSHGADLIVTGDDLDHASGADLDRLVSASNVFARTRPEQKHLIIQALRRSGEVVAMTGDGINDAPALREADIGIAMGRRGTEAARAAASFVLLDDDFSTIVDAVRGGRRIFDNLTRAFAYLIAFHPPLLLGALLIPMLGRPLLLLPIHLVLLELLLHPIVSLVFQADPADPDVMRRAPRRADEALRLGAMWRAYAIGLTVAVGVVSTHLVALHIGWTTDQARAIGFATLLAAQPPLLLSMRSPERPLWNSGRPWTPTLSWVIAVLLATPILVVELGPIAALLQLDAFPLTGWGIVGLVALASTTWAEPLKRPRSVPANTPTT